MQPLLISPSPWRVVFGGWIWLGFFMLFAALPVLPGVSIFEEGNDWMAIALYVLLLMIFGYVVFRKVVRSFFAKLEVRSGELQFSTMGERKVVNLREIKDLDFMIYGSLRRHAPLEDELFLLLSDQSTLESWKIGSGWTWQDLGLLVKTIRTELKQRGIKTFPLLQSKLYGSSKKGS